MNYFDDKAVLKFWYLKFVFAFSAFLLIPSTVSATFIPSEKNLSKWFETNQYRRDTNTSSDTFLFERAGVSFQFQDGNNLIQARKNVYRMKSKTFSLDSHLYVDTNTIPFIEEIVNYFEKLEAERPAKNIEPPAPSFAISEFKNISSSGKLDAIFIDPGHGGSDPGAISYGIEEKSLTLMVALELSEHLRKKLPEQRIILTRTNDIFLTLEDRCNIANTRLQPGENGIFISIHFNIWFDPVPSGFEIFYLSHDSKNEAARIKATRENRVFKDNPNLGGLSPIEVLLGRFEVIQYQKESLFLSDLINNKVATHAPMYTINRGIKSENFYVLKGVLMPSVLVEVGFLSNIKDMEFINVPENRLRILEGISGGIFEYIDEFEKTSAFRKRLF